MPKKRKTNKVTSKKRAKTARKPRKIAPIKRVFQAISSAKSFIIFGLILLALSGIYHIYEITKYSFTTVPKVVKQLHRLPSPIYITIEGTDMSFPVVDTVIQHGVWQIADNGASHLALSANPGENGTIIIYGHNTLVRFGSLPYVFLGQKVSLITADKKDHEYVIQKTQVVDPTDTKILTSQKGEVLILYTCYGFADLQRFMVFAYPVKTP